MKFFTNLKKRFDDWGNRQCPFHPETHAKMQESARLTRERLDRKARERQTRREEQVRRKAHRDLQKHFSGLVLKN